MEAITHITKFLTSHGLGIFILSTYSVVASIVIYKMALFIIKHLNQNNDELSKLNKSLENNGRLLNDIIRLFD